MISRKKTSVLEVYGLTKSFGGIKALDNFDLNIREKELIGIIGPNGAGKTTLFNLLTGFLPPDKGKILFKNYNITNWKPYKIANIGISRTFQIVDLFKDMTVLENVLIPCFSKRTRNKWPSKKFENIAISILDKMGLKKRQNELARNLPFGELRLLDIARAMISEPDVLLLDEPFSGLATEDIEILSKLIKEMHEKGQTILIIEHRIKYLIKLSERVVVIVFGKKLAEGRSEEIINNDQVIKVYLGAET